MSQRETNLVNLRPFTAFNGNSTRVAQTTFEGSLYEVDNPIDFNRINWRATAAAGSPTGRILFYQSNRGTLDETFYLVAQATAIAVAAPGAFETALDGGVEARIEPGKLFVLWGRDSAAGSFTTRAFSMLALDFYTQNILTGGVPTTFSTAIAANTAPSTVAPASLVVSGSNTAPIMWLRRV